MQQRLRPKAIPAECAGNCYAAHSGTHGGLQSSCGVFDNDYFVRGDAQQFGCFQVDLWVRLAVGHLVAADKHVQKVTYPDLFCNPARSFRLR